MGTVDEREGEILVLGVEEFEFPVARALLSFKLADSVWILGFDVEIGTNAVGIINFRSVNDLDTLRKFSEPKAIFIAGSPDDKDLACFNVEFSNNGDESSCVKDCELEVVEGLKGRVSVAALPNSISARGNQGDFFTQAFFCNCLW